MKTLRVKVLRVIDGDTVVVAAGGGFLRSADQRRIRLYGIDAPESSQKGGKESTRHLERLIGSRKKMWMEDHGSDKYGRTVGSLYPKRNRPRNSYNYMMVRDGQARVYMAKAEDKQRFEAAQQEAHRRRRGIWKQKNAQAPWDYRRQNREKEETRARWKFRLVVALVALAGLAALAVTVGSGSVPDQLPLPDVPMPDIPFLSDILSLI